jgi:IclR family acetate operon transcriptional repressor
VSLEHRLTAHAVGVGMSQGRSELLYTSAVGKALLLDHTREELITLLGSSWPARTDRTITTVDALYSVCTRSKGLGFTVDDQEDSIGVCCVAAPVRDHTGEIVAAIGISAPALRLPHQRIGETGALVAEAAERFSRRLGFVPDTSAQSPATST